MKHEMGMSLLEILVVVAIFAILGIIVTRSIILSIGGSKKSESLVKVRENLDYSLAIIERQLRNADSITICPLPASNLISYKDLYGNTGTFSCENLGGLDPYIASGSARLSSSSVKITSCSFTCTSETSTNPALVTISLEAEDAETTGIQKSKVTTSTQVYLRNY